MVPLLLDLTLTYQLDQKHINPLFDSVKSTSELNSLLPKLTRDASRMLTATVVHSKNIISEEQKEEVERKLSSLIQDQLSILASQYFILIHKVEVKIA